MLWLKLALVPLSVWLASQVGRRFGHAVAGVLSGLPMIAGPLIAVLMIDHDAAVVAPIAVATLRAMPGTVAFLVAYAWLAMRAPTGVCLAGAALAFGVAGAGASALALPAGPAAALALACPLIALAAMPRVPPLRGPVPIPRREIVWRMIAATGLAAVIVWGADRFAPRVNGLLLAWPITGSILPSFTLPLHGRIATVNLLRGFANGLVGFALFFGGLTTSLAIGIGRWPAFALAIGVAVAGAAGVYHWRARRATDRCD